AGTHADGQRSGRRAGARARRRRARGGSADPLGARIGARGSDAVALGRRAAAQHRDAAARRGLAAGLRPPAGRAPPGRPRVRHRLQPRNVAAGARRRGPRARLPGVLRALRDAVHRDHRAGLPQPGQRAVRRAPASRLDPAVDGAPGTRRAQSRRGRARAGASSPRGFVPQISERAGRAIALPVPSGSHGAATSWLVAVPESDSLADFERFLAHHAVMVVALAQMRERVVAETERRLAGDVLGLVLSGRIDADEVAARLAPFEISGMAAVLVLAVEDPETLEDELARILSDLGAKALVATVG